MPAYEIDLVLKCIQQYTLESYVDIKPMRKVHFPLAFGLKRGGGINKYNVMIEKYSIFCCQPPRMHCSIRFLFVFAIIDQI